MKKFNDRSIIVFAVIFICMVLCSCGQAVINSESDEIRLYSWEYAGDYGIKANLSFENDNAVLTVRSKDEYCEISGLCVFGEDSFVIIDNSLKKEYFFGYTLSGLGLELTYNENRIKFKKTEKK
ncbi:MAG: hypothetical protein II685_01450 [Clostridia bacterium]|nr:hypothetical protein [Clostridia bacterium]